MRPCAATRNAATSPGASLTVMNAARFGYANGRSWLSHAEALPTGAMKTALHRAAVSHLNGPIFESPRFGFLIKPLYNPAILNHDCSICEREQPLVVGDEHGRPA